MRSFILFIFQMLIISSFLHAQDREFRLTSPDGKLSLVIHTGENLEWSLFQDETQIFLPSPVALELENGEILGENTRIRSSGNESVDTGFQPLNYKKDYITDRYNQLVLNFRENYGIIFRVYNRSMAYRFFTKRKGELTVLNEKADFNFTADHTAFIPYMTDYRDGRIFNCSFEAFYDVHRISAFKKDSLAFLPVLVDIGRNKKVVILEADLEDYPGMFLDINATGKGFKGVFAPYPLELEQKGINYIPVKRAGYIAKTAGTRNFPWRVVVISNSDRELLDVDIVQKLAAPPRIDDTSWIESGQVAWDWWNALNVSHVDFKAGINTETYKYYIDFAAANGLPYIILDGGWSSPGDLTKTRPEIDLPAILAYGKEKGTGVILWASWYGILQQMEEVFPLYEKMGVKGFKIDFIDRDDQLAVRSTYEIAKKAAEHHLLVDFHGIYKPTGLQRTYPNVIGYEGVRGMEYTKWAAGDVPGYDVTIPYIRMMAGPMDYTPGAMRNANRENFRPVNANPMSQGTRCHQLAMYVIFDAPLQMLSDNPTIYMREQACTDFIVDIPVMFDRTIPLGGEVGEYVALAHKKGDRWYAGAMTNWEPRDITLDLSFLENGSYRAIIFRDGINAERDATDYIREESTVTAGDQLNVSMSPGGGWAASFIKLD